MFAVEGGQVRGESFDRVLDHRRWWRVTIHGPETSVRRPVLLRTESRPRADAYGRCADVSGMVSAGNRRQKQEANHEAPPRTRSPQAVALIWIGPASQASYAASDTGHLPEPGQLMHRRLVREPDREPQHVDDYGRTAGCVDVRYSHKCQTNWLTITGNPTAGPVATSLWSDAGGSVGEYDTVPTQSTYTKQVYAPGATCIHFQVHMAHPRRPELGETYDPGANFQTVC